MLKNGSWIALRFGTLFLSVSRLLISFGKIS